MNKERTNTANKKQRLSACTEAYKEHIMYTFNAFCRVVIRYATLNSWRDRSRKRQREISFEYLTEEKFYPFSTSNKYFIDPYEQYPITICGQTVILTNGELAAALLSLPEKKREIIYLYFFGHYTQQEIGEMYGRCRSTAWHHIHSALQILDDFGMERGTEYGLEQVYNVIDSRYRSRKPLIVTTNLTLEELQNPEDTAHARIYDRLTEMCTPVRITGENFRKARAREKMEQLKTLLNRKESL